MTVQGRPPAPIVREVDHVIRPLGLAPAVELGVAGHPDVDEDDPRPVGAGVLELEGLAVSVRVRLGQDEVAAGVGGSNDIPQD